MLCAKVVLRIITILVSLQLATLVQAIDIHVDDSAPGGNGFSWPNALNDLQVAIGMANGGDTIHVAQGTYKPGTLRTHTFSMESGVIWLGGYIGYNAADPSVRDPALYPSILSGDLGNNDSFTPGAMGQPGTYTNYGDNSYHVVTAASVDETAVIDGFTIRGGNASQGIGGGAMLVTRSASGPTIRQCKILQNRSTTYGGAINIEAGSIEIRDTEFRENLAVSFHGGAISAIKSEIRAYQCVFKRNFSDSGVGGAINHDTHPPVSPLRCVNCRFVENGASTRGGAVWTDSYLTALINSLFSRNVLMEPARTEALCTPPR